MQIRPVREVSPWSLSSGVQLRELIRLPHGLVISGKLLMALFAFLLWLIRHYVVTGTVFMLLGTYVQFGTLWLAVPLALIVPAAYWATRIGVAMAAGEASTVPAVISGLNRARIARRSWHRVLRQLKMHARGDQEEVPPLVSVVPTMTGFKGKIITGSIAMDSNKLVKAEAELASGFFCDRVIVRPETPSVASVRFDWGQHLRSVYRLDELPSLPPAQANTPARIRFGINADGTAASIVSNLSTLIGGTSGGGKSSTAWALIAGYLEQIPIRLRVVDPSGIEFADLGAVVGQGLVHDYVADPNLPGARQMDDFWGDLTAAFNKRLQRVSESGQRWHRPTRDEPLDITVIDELLPIAEDMKKNPTSHIVGRIAYLGRKAGFVVIALTQASQVDTIGRTRDLFPQRISHRTVNRYNTDAVLGDGAESEGARASHLDITHDRGVAYMAAHEVRGYMACRAAWVPDTETKQLAGGQRPIRVNNKAPEPCSVYAFYNSRKEWLYVGKAEADRVDKRWAEHANDKTWWPEVAEKVVVDTYPDAETALTAEAVLIKKHKPRYNKQHNMRNYQG